jgi:hypothetical protein
MTTPNHRHEGETSGAAVHPPLATRHSTLATRFLREPLVHFLFIGVGLFLLFSWRGGSVPLQPGQPGPQSGKIIIAPGDIDQMVATFTRTWQRPPTEEETKGLLEGFIRDEIYYREALAIGLDRDDAVLRRRLRQKMEFVFEDITAQVEPTDEDLRAFMKKRPDRYLVDPQVSFQQVYVNGDKRGKNASNDAAEILGKLNSGADPDTVGDPSLLESDIKLSPMWDISKQFGEQFSRKLLELKPDTWTGPVQSGFGLHLVFVRKRVGGRPPELKEVREMVKRDWAFERQKELKDAAYAKLRERYVVIVEKRNGDGKSAPIAISRGYQR